MIYVFLYMCSFAQLYSKPHNIFLYPCGKEWSFAELGEILQYRPLGADLTVLEMLARNKKPSLSEGKRGYMLFGPELDSYLRIVVFIFIVVLVAFVI